MFAIEESDALLLVVDGREGLAASDEQVMDRLRGHGLPIVVVVNKADTKAAQEGYQEFYALGAEGLVLVSAEHGAGLGDPARRAGRPSPRRGAGIRARGIRCRGRRSAECRQVLGDQPAAGKRANARLAHRRHDKGPDRQPPAARGRTGLSARRHGRHPAPFSSPGPTGRTGGDARPETDRAGGTGRPRGRREPGDHGR